MMTKLRRQDGFTLIEVLIAMTLALIIFAATLNVLNVFSSDSQAMTETNAAQNQARLAIDRIARQLRNIASPVTIPKLLEVALPYDIVFETIGTPSQNNPQGTERVRYCIPPDTNPGSPSAEVLLEQVQTWDNASTPADPWDPTLWNPTTGVPCPDPAYPSTAVALSVTNRSAGADHQAFTYNDGPAPSDLSTIDTVGIDLFVNPTPRLTRAESELSSAVFLRNQERAPVAGFTYTPLGSGSVLLSAGTSYSPSGESLSYSWSCTGSTPCTSSGAVFVWNPGPGTYTVTLSVTDQAGLQPPPLSEQVTVT